MKQVKGITSLPITMAIWKKIEGYNYSISDDKSVRNDKNNKILNQEQGINSSRVTLCKDGKTKRFNVNILHMEYFGDNSLEWFTIPNHETYEITKCGKIRHKDTPYTLKTLRTDPAGYLRVSLWEDNHEWNPAVHRLIAQTFVPNPENKPQVDHINHNTLDIRIENLRWCTQTENNMNKDKQANNTSGFKGVTANGSGWTAQIGFNNEHFYLGHFKTKEEAHEAYLVKYRELGGEFVHDDLKI